MRDLLSKGFMFSRFTFPCGSSGVCASECSAVLGLSENPAALKESQLESAAGAQPRAAACAAFSDRSVYEREQYSQFCVQLK